MMKRIFIILAFLLVTFFAHGQDRPNENKLSSWLTWQFIPNLTVTSTPTQAPFGFEWEATPLLYSFGISKLVSPWYSLIVEPTARFTGSIELVITAQFYPNKLGSSHFGYSGQLLGHIPLIEHGEHLTLNIGLAKYRIGNEYPLFKVVGISTLFGFVHINLKQSSNPTFWMGSFEIRMF